MPHQVLVLRKQTMARRFNWKGTPITCYDCGKPLEAGENIVSQNRAHSTTSYRCVDCARKYGIIE